MAYIDPKPVAQGGFGSSDSPQTNNAYNFSRYQDYLYGRGEFVGQNPNPLVFNPGAPVTRSTSGVPSTYVPPVAPQGSTTPSTATSAPTTGNVLPGSTVQSYLPPEIQNWQQQTYSYPDTSNMPLTSNDKVTLESGFPGVAPLVFDFAAETKGAYDSLRPFYDKLLSFAGGDLDLAKRVLTYTYDSGMRQAKAEASQATEEEGIRKYQETTQKMTDQNRRGVIGSGFGATERKQMNRSQELRQEAIDRSLKERESTLTTDKGFGTEREERQFGKTSFDLERQRRTESQNIAKDKYGIKSDIFQSQLQKAGLEEQRKIQAEAIARSGGGSSGGSIGSSGGGTGYTGEEVRARGINPDTLVSTNGKFYL